MNKIATWLLKGYKKYLSPIFTHVLGNACRFTPSCSEYTIGALEKYGLIKGVALGTKRFFRCNPLSKPGYDPLPN